MHQKTFEGRLLVDVMKKVTQFVTPLPMNVQLTPFYKNGKWKVIVSWCKEKEENAEF